MGRLERIAASGNLEDQALSPQELTDQLEQAAVSRGLLVPGEHQKPGLAHTLFTIYALMLADTKQRLLCAPEKQRLAFLNCRRTQHLPARAGKTFAVFQLAEGYDEPVLIPEDTILSADQGEDASSALLFRTRAGFYAHPIHIQDVFWADRSRDEVGGVYEYDGINPPYQLRLWEPQNAIRNRHRMDLVFSRAFSGMDGGRQVCFTADAALDDTPIDIERLADRNRYRWSLLPLLDEDSPEYSIPLIASAVGNGVLQLETRRNTPPVHCPGKAVLRLELLYKGGIGLALENPAVLPGRRNVAPDAILAGGRKLPATGFYPFQNPMQPFESCLIVCNEALMQRGAEIKLLFQLKLEISEERIPEIPEVIDYRWVMRKPIPTPEPKLWEAFAQAVLWEYWNGEAFCQLFETTAAFSEEGEVRLSFQCPEDIQPCNSDFTTGYGIRLSCGMCNALYQIPRRVYTPHLSNIRFSYRYPLPEQPVAAESCNFGQRYALQLDSPLRPFTAPLCADKALFLGFQKLPEMARLQFCVRVSESHSQKKQVSCDFMGPDGPTPCFVQDQTYSFRTTGMLCCTTPAPVAKTELFGKSRYWLRLSSPDFLTRTVVSLDLNAQEVENRMRHTEYFQLSDFARTRTLYLKKQNLVEAWMSIRSPHDEQEHWLGAYKAGESVPGDDSVQVDWRHGSVTLSDATLERFGESLSGGTVAVVYDSTDAEQGNVAAGALNRMMEEIPFVAAVFNPLPVVNGCASESDERLARRVEDLLYCGDRAITARDYEKIAVAFCPYVRQARFSAGRRPRLALLLQDGCDLAFPEIRRELEQLFARKGCCSVYGEAIDLFRVIPTPMRLRIRLWHESGPETEVNRYEESIRSFFNPFSGGFCAEGWKLGHLPRKEQIEAFLYTQLQGTLLQVAVRRKKGWVDLDQVKQNWFQVPGAVEIVWET